MMAKPAATKDRPRNKLKGRPPRPDPPLLRNLPPQPPPPPSIRRRRSLLPRRRRQLCEVDDHDLDQEEEEEEEEEEGGLKKKLRLVVKLPRSPPVRESLHGGRPRRLPAAIPSSSSSSSSSSPASSSSSSYVDEEEPEEDVVKDEETIKPSRKRQIDSATDAAAFRSSHHEEGKKSVVGRSLGDGSGNLPAPRSGTPMPERKELESVLDKLQKKDTYGAFAEPVDPVELPDYHDVIEHPMDFGTARKKLVRGAYRSFEQFEDDIFLICSNAMQYNAPDTIYFRQACTIQDMARKKFQNIRDNVKSTETDQRSEEKTRLNSMEKKTQHTECTPLTQCKPAVEPLAPDIYSGATLVSPGNACTRLSTENGAEKSVACTRLNTENGVEKSVACTRLSTENEVEKSVACTRLSTENGDEKSVACTRLSTENGKSVACTRLCTENGVDKSVACTRLSTENGVEKSVACTRLSTENGVEKFVAVNGLVDASSSIGESKGESKQEKGDDFSVKCSPSKLGRKATLVDENRRATYNVTPEKKPKVESDCVLNVFEDEHKQLAPVELDAEHSYARSLARFAASLGPVAWEIVSKKIEKALPPGMKFGSGWVGEYEPPPTSFLSFESHNQQLTSSSSTSQSSKAKVPEMKSKAGQYPASTNMNLGLRNQVTTAVPRKASNSCERMPCENSGEQKPRVVGVASADSKINGAGLRMKSRDSFNSKNSGYNNEMNKESSCVASVRVKEESPSEETTERRQSLIGANHSTRTISMASNQQKNPATLNFNNTYSNISQQVSMEKTTERKQVMIEANDKTERTTGMASNQQKNQATFKLTNAVTNISQHASTEETTERKQAIIQADATGMASDQQKNQATFKFTNAYANISQQASMEETTERKQTMIQAEEITQRAISMASNQQTNQTTFSFANAYSNISQQAPMGKPYSKATHYSFPGIISKNSSHVQTETCNEFGAVPSNVLGIGGCNKGIRIDNPLAFVSGNQTGVNSSLGHCNTHEQASSDPFKLVGFSGKVSNQQYISSSSMSHLEQSTPTISPLSRENHSQATSAAARAWMSVGSSAQWKAVDGRNTSEKPITSSPLCSPTWKPLTSATQMSGDSVVRHATFPMQVFSEASPIKNRGLVIFPQLISTDLPKFQSHSPWQGLSSQPQTKKRDNLPPDLNIGYQPPSSPVQPSNVALDSQQPDLALQL